MNTTKLSVQLTEYECMLGLSFNTGDDLAIYLQENITLSKVIQVIHHPTGEHQTLLEATTVPDKLFIL